MTLFEQWSLIAYFSQLALIGGGLWMMHKPGQRRDRQLDEQSARMEALITGSDDRHEESMLALRALLERPQ